MKLVSWNVQWGRNASGIVDLARTVREARRLADFDVLCLQEITRGFHALPGGPGDDQFAELAALLPGFTVIEAIGADLPPVSAHAGRSVGKRRQFGNALATRLPVAQVFRHLLPWPADEAAPSMQRVALEAVLDVSGATTAGGALRILVTHLEFYSERQRLAQVDELRRLQREAAGHAAQPAPAENADGPFARTARPASAIVCGDFNSEWNSAAYRRMLAPIDDSPAFIDAWAALHPGATPPPTAGVYDTQQWPDGPISCDFVFVTEDLSARLKRCEFDGATQASDHQPVVLDID
ncbi:endonuclease [Paraburkholderia bannensis]|uniref:Metal-dependent hydrolase, endonuclease/exonuclease/phosphatase family n=1 Tax=Paraburkholderia tropica TaxID=92647 RepID=A0AAQ1GH00_9BURK|nr:MULTISPECIES: endonuclease/exonuclease/phosphatase family protein [Paraburkholderia]QNB11461.1 endonuclease [Paraburkholderia tropica]RQM48551.1 endonuclease [Paraburkholderia bannensis]RQN35630.1 endonuclease [Paraburkholderia tropica]SEJ84619.1 Metal-dependent hydrolase, endonuclease/exonuclease/phosphatase family [Paraburkholderia tropica]